MRVQADQNLHSIYLPAHGLGISSILFASEMEADVVFCLSSDRLSPLEVYMKERNIWTLNYRTHRLCVYVNNDTKLKYLLNKRVGELISSAKQSNLVDYLSSGGELVFYCSMIGSVRSNT